MARQIQESPVSQIERAEGIYLYCFARESALVVIGESGLDNHQPPVHWVFKDIVAMVSRLGLDAWTGLSGEANLQDLNWIGPRACRHEEIIEQVMHYSPVLPARFGTLFSSLESLESFLGNNYDSICGFLDYVADKEEWAVKGFLNKIKAERCFLPSDSMFSFSHLSPGSRYLLEQQLRAEAAKKMRSWIKIVRRTITQELAEHAVDSRALKTLSLGTPRSNGNMVLNRAFLLCKEAKEAFRSLVKQIGEAHSSQGLTLNISGPWPPYSFCPSLRAPRGIVEK